MTFSMKFPDDIFTIKERIELLERSILVNSYAYYELDENILPDYMYDANTVQLEQFIKQFPQEFLKSRYYKYFYDFCSDEDGTHNSTGFDLISRLSKNKKLYKIISHDAHLALKYKKEKMA